MQGIITVSRNDFYDFLRCPKIVALKIHRNSVQPPKPKLQTRSLQYEIGTIGEVATKEVFSESGDEILDEFGEPEEYDEYESEDFSLPKILEVNLSQKGVNLDNEMKRILRDTVQGLKTIKKYLTDEYGEIRILGKAESKNGILPSKIKPDFMAISSDTKKPILIEVKNTSKPNPKPDTFQASFYNSIAQKYGVMVLEERLEGGMTSIIPKLLQNVTSETLLIYPRRGEYEKISETVPVNNKIANEIWQAKLLGLLGKTPHTDCDSRCPHHRFGDLPEDNVEPAIPLPLVYAQGLREQNKDLDLDFLSKFFYKKGVGKELKSSIFDFRYAEWNLDLIKEKLPKKYEKKKKSIQEKREKYLEMFSEKTGIKRNVVDKLAEIRVNTWKDDKKILKEMTNEINPWKKILGKNKFKKMNPYIKGYTTQIYSLPEQSNQFIKKSWQSWND